MLRVKVIYELMGSESYELRVSSFKFKVSGLKLRV
jgi:hypothetical protein